MFQYFLNKWLALNMLRATCLCATFSAHITFHLPRVLLEIRNDNLKICYVVNNNYNIVTSCVRI